MRANFRWSGRGTRLAIWLLLCGGSLGLVALKPDGGTIFVVSLLLLTFPAGFAGIMIFDLLYEGLGLEESMPATIGTVWVLMVGAGYLQWFVLVPWIARRWDRLATRDVDE